METYQRAEVFVRSFRVSWLKPLSNANFDSNFLAKVANTVQELFVSFTDDLSGTSSERPKYEEVEDVCSKLKMGISGADVD